ncbi:MAG: 3D domain-containing protein [Methanobrevibacter sp.]|nr:3D domain-containing protein [Methanobrevibacter sp.]MBO7712464.1 3D domain-containing protein [Methanobrevibacter sp.]
MIFKKVISTIIAVDCALGCITCGVKTAEERTLEKMSAYIDEVDDYNPVETAKSSPYVKKNLGAFSLTFYVPDKQWGYQTSTGVKSVHKKTCAVDPRVIPLGSRIRIIGNNGEILDLLCCDIGGGIKGNKIDVFYDGSVKSGYDWIARFGTIHNVYLLEE